PWRLSLVDPQGGPVLTEHPGTGPGPTGTLGFRAAGVWRHATRVLSSRREGAAYVAELATTDPLRRIELRLRPDAEGVIELVAKLVGPTVDVQALGMGFEGRASERYLGFGERSNAVDQGGNVVENYVSDGPYQAEEYPFINAFAPPWGLRERPDSTYFPVPWLLSDAGYGVLVDNPETSYFRLGTDAGAWSVEVVAAPDGELTGASVPPAPQELRLRFFAGPEPAGALRRFTAATGRQPPPAAPWLLGAWYQAKDEVAQLAAQRKADVPVSVLQTYLHYLPCGEQQGVEAAQPERTGAAHAAGVAITTYFNPMVCANYQPAFGLAEAAGALTRSGLGRPTLYRYGASPEDSNLVGQYDFFRDAGREAYGELLGEAIGDGYDGWMEDFGEYTPLDSASGDGIDGTRAHNPYVTRYHCAAFDETRERRPEGVVRFQRSGWTGAAPCADVVWGGDPTTDFDFDGLRSSVRQALSIGVSGIGIWGSDIGGFFAIGQRKLTPELLTRWVQFGAVSTVMRTQANGVALPPKARPQVTDPDQLDNWRRYTKLHTALYPYLVAAIENYRGSGLPVMRHMALAYPKDREAGAREDQFLFGPDLLAAPVLDSGAREHAVYLPAGRWVDLWRSVEYTKGSGGLRLGRPRTLDGAREVTLPAPLEELPLAAKAGTLLAMLPPDVDTLAPYGEGEGLVKLSDRRGALELLAFPSGTSSAGFYYGERLRSSEGQGRWTLSVEGARTRRYSLQASMATLRDPIEPCQVTLDGNPLASSAWSYDSERAALSVAFRTRTGRLVASERCGRKQAAGGEEGPGGREPAAEKLVADRGTGDTLGTRQPSDGDASLPFTGLGLGVLVLAALALLGSGLVLRGRTRTRRATHRR
ncbi:MAG: glycoside hydrolase family 31 protein, partial [Thermoleophilaceae bacterium]|nr:glycoside hydrolase family 31 protein [Thermoleophilaceae bacterium]